MQHQSCSEKVLLQRIRNRAIDCLEIAADEDAHASFGPNAVINWWDDFRDAALRPCPISSLSKAEVAALLDFDAAWNAVANGTSNPMPSLPDLTQDPQWQTFVAAARHALSIFSILGRLPED
jgi:hypothetical protein